VFGYRLIRDAIESLVEIIRQRLFKLRAVYYFLLVIRHNLLTPCSSTSFRDVICNLNRDYPHSLQYLCQLDAAAVDSRLHRSLRYLQDVDYLLVGHFLDIAEYDACLEIAGQLVNSFLDLSSELTSLHLFLGGISDRSEMVLMIVDRVGHRVLRIPLSMAIVVDDQIPRQPHQPIREITLFGVVLIEGPVDADENLLREILGRVGIRSKSVSEIEDASRKSLNDFFPGNAIAPSRSSHEFRTVDLHCSL
jgi:signal transduction histidine kinase